MSATEKGTRGSLNRISIEFSKAFTESIEGAIVSHEFFITNEGVSDLEILHVGASCGCTVAKPEDEKLEPGESTLLKVTFDSAHKVGNKRNYVWKCSYSSYIIIISSAGNL